MMSNQVGPAPNVNPSNSQTMRNPASSASLGFGLQTPGQSTQAINNGGSGAPQNSTSGPQIQRPSNAGSGGFQTQNARQTRGSCFDPCYTYNKHPDYKNQYGLSYDYITKPASYCRPDDFVCGNAPQYRTGRGYIGQPGMCTSRFTCLTNSPACQSPKLKCECSPLSLDAYWDPFKLPKNRRPAWLAYCGTVLRFCAYYQESVPESRNENYRVHQVEIRYYRDDGTMEVYEPPTFDPAFPQGVIIGRQKIPMPAPAHNENYSLEDLDVGCEITLFGKTFFITGVDDCTRRHLNRVEGRGVAHNICMPDDCYTNFRHDAHWTSRFPKLAHHNLDQDKRRKFLERKAVPVLRFWSYWDSRCDCDNAGLLRHFLFHYYLTDDTVEIREIVDPEGKIKGNIPFLNRGRLLKDHKDLVPIVGNKEEALIILNVTATGEDCQYQVSPTFMTDKLCPGIEEKEYITDQDLAIGAVINVYGRSFILVDCDTATQTYYREKYGVEDFTPLTLDNCELPQEYPRMDTPPHIGIGDEADTLWNWNRLQREPPPNPKNELPMLIEDTDMLCFDAQLYNCLQKVNAARRFAFRVYMIDNTMEILEKPHPNTGFTQGRFLARSKVRRRDGGYGTSYPPRFEIGEETEYYCPKDYFIGNILEINGFTFQLTGAAEMTLCYMEANPAVFPQSNFCLIIEKAKEVFGPLEGECVLKMFSCNDNCRNGVISMEDFRSILISASKEGLSEHEIITLSRGLKVVAPNPGVDFQTLQAVVQTELQRHGFDHFLLARVEYTLRYHDPCRFGHVDRETVRATLKGARLPLDRLLVDFLVDHFTCVDDCNRINYCALLHFMDYVENCVPSASPASIFCVLKWLEPTNPNKNVTCVNYRAFLDLINPNFTCDLPSVCCPKPEPCCEYVNEECDQEEDNSCRNQCPPEDDSYCAQRERAGYVFNDNAVRSESLRCQDQDLGVCCKEGHTVDWQNSTRLSDELVDAYEPCCDPCTNELEEGTREVFNRCDYIGSEDLYDRPQCLKDCCPKVWDPKYKP